jgi:2-octaprenyl-6-methoxyphenol hydroxylase
MWRHSFVAVEHDTPVFDAAGDALTEIDVLVVGGGLTGAALMLALADSPYRTMLIESTPFVKDTHVDFDARSLALSPASMRVLSMLHVWPLLQDKAQPIETIHVSEQGAFGSAHFNASAQHPLGFVVEMQHISAALHQLLDKQRVLAPAQLVALDAEQGIATVRVQGAHQKIKARLIVAADGAHSAARDFCGLTTTIKEYNQHAIVANIGLARPHRQVAFEQFTQAGPVALLPLMGRRSSLVWAMKPQDADRLMQLPDTLFLKKLQQQFGYRLGRFTQVGRRVVYPLRQALMSQQVMGRVVFVGNAAHTLHPVAGQGFNLGLRDVAMLAQCIIQQGLSDEMLTSYEASRRYDQTAITRFTDGLVDLFTSRLPGLKFARGMGLLAVDGLPWLKELIARYARGFAGVIPDLVCGIALGAE